MYREQSFNNLLLGGGGDWCPRWICFYRLKRGFILSYYNVVITTSPLSMSAVIKWSCVRFLIYPFTTYLISRTKLQSILIDT